jgi:hypothetical protein
VKPDLTLYTQHRQAPDATLDGVSVPGLHGTYYSRPDGSRVATVGVYRYDGVELFWAWGYADEAHCAFHAVRQPDGEWSSARRGCPRVAFAPGPPHVRVDHELRVVLGGVSPPLTS